MKVQVYIDHDFVHTAHLTAGLLDLAGEGLLKVKFSWPHKPFPKLAGPMVIRLKVTHSNSEKSVRHAFDYHDVNDRFDLSALLWSDYYWKSNYNLDKVKLLPTNLQNKIFKYGLHYPSRSRHDKNVNKRLLGSAIANLQYRWNKQGKKLSMYDGYAALILRRKRYLSRLYIDEYEDKVEDKPIGVYFHPGCWPMNGDMNKLTNIDRQNIIKELKHNLGDMFMGGFTNNNTAIDYFPEETFYASTSHREYVNNLQSSQIVISTNGLNGCHSWRTAEALAAGAIVVTEMPKNELTDAISPGENIFYYQSPEECVDICNRVLSLNTEDIDQLHQLSNEYYAEHVNPSRSIFNKINI